MSPLASSSQSLPKTSLRRKNNYLPAIPAEKVDLIYLCYPNNPTGATATREQLEACEAIGLSIFGGINAPYVWVGCPEGVTSWDMFDRMLEEAQVVITPGAGFGAAGEGYFRISAFNSRENIEEVCRRIAENLG